MLIKINRNMQKNVQFKIRQQIYLLEQVQYFNEIALMRSLKNFTLARISKIQLKGIGFGRNF